MDLGQVGRTSAPVSRRWGPADALLYAVGVGAGQEDPCTELAFTTENTAGVTQQILPTYATTLAVGPPAEMVAGVAPGSLLHAAEELVLHRPLPLTAQVAARATVERIEDKGAHAVIVTRTALADDHGEPLATVRRSTFVRGGGGFGGQRGPRVSWERPQRTPDLTHTVRLPAGQALVYRLSGDRDRLHSDPGCARDAGLSGPLVHGLCLYGYAGRILVAQLCGGDATALTAISARFARPLVVGEHTLTLVAWRDAAQGVFALLDAAGESVLDHGRFQLTAR